MKRIYYFFAAISLLAISCKPDEKLKKFSFKGETMGSYYAVTYYAKTSIIQQTQVDSFLQSFNKSLSTWDKNSLITAINTAEKKHTTDSFFRALYRKSKEVNHISNGAFDPTASPLFEAWGFGLKNAEAMDSLRVDSLLSLVGIDKCYLKGDTLYKAVNGIQFSFNAIAPGYAADLLGEFFAQKGINIYLIDIGGEFASKGKKPNGYNWTVSIEKPVENKTAQNEAIAYIRLQEGEALATSGNYRKFYYKNGKKYSHTINPITGYPVNHNLLSVTIVANNATTADAFATTCMVLGLEKGKAFIKQQEAKAYFIYDENGALNEYISETLTPQFSK